LQRICDRLGRGAVKQFFWRWQRRLPSPFTRADLRAGYTYELAVRQFEVSDTRVSDRPASGRAFFEGVIRDHLDIGRPSQVALIFDRRISKQTPGTFRTKVITKGVDPQLVCYKASRIKQYFKEHRALRTETVVGDTRDFGIGRRVTSDNWRALRAAGEQANRRLCDAQAADARPAPDLVTLQHVTRPSVTPTACTPRHALWRPTSDGGAGRPGRVLPSAGGLHQPPAHRAGRRAVGPLLQLPAGHL